MNDEIIVSILTYNKLEYTKKCLESLFKSNQLPYHRIVVTDNGSSDDTKTWLRSLGNKIRFIDNHVNVGFAEAHNNVMREYPQHDVVLVNNDMPAGSHKINFNAGTLSSGVYFYRIISGEFNQTKKFVLLK